MDRLSLAGENFPIDAQQVLAFHARLARHAAHQNRPIDVLEPSLQIIRRHHALEQRERTVVQFHDHPAQRFDALRDFNQMQDDRLVRTKDGTGSDARQQGITNLTGGTGHRNAKGGFHR